MKTFYTILYLILLGLMVAFTPMGMFGAWLADRNWIVFKMIGFGLCVPAICCWAGAMVVGEKEMMA